MRTYCYHCPSCLAHWTAPTTEVGLCPQCGEGARRDYRAEAVGVGPGVRTVGRPATNREMANLFLPQASDFAGPGDPDGAKGLRQWADDHDPKPGNTNPSYPEGIPRRSY